MPNVTRRRAQQSTVAVAIIGLIGTVAFGGVLCTSAHVLDRAVTVQFLVLFLVSLCTAACGATAVIIGRANDTLVSSIAAATLLRQVVEDNEPARPQLKVVEQR